MRCGASRAEGDAARSAANSVLVDPKYARTALKHAHQEGPKGFNIRQ